VKAKSTEQKLYKYYRGEHWPTQWT